jgi:hypothetical protein
MDTGSKVTSTSSPNFISTGSKHAVTRTYPKPGQEQSVSLDQGEPYDRPGGSAVTFTAAKSGQKQSP